MSQAIETALARERRDRARLIFRKKDTSEIDARIVELEKERAAVFKMTMETSNRFYRRAAGVPTFAAAPSGEEAFRCRGCCRLLGRREHGYCYACKAESRDFS